MSEFKGKITVAVSVAIVATLALAVAVAIFSPSTFQSNTSQSSAGSTILSSNQEQTSSTYNLITGSIASSQSPKTSSSSYSTGSSTTTSSSPSAMAGVTTIVIPLGAGANPSESSGFSSPIFVPSQVTVVVGVNNTIVVRNEDNESHWFVFTSLPVGASTPQLVDTPQLAPGQNFTFTLTTPGVYNFEDAWHPLWPHGSITVVAASQQSNSTSDSSTCSASSSSPGCSTFSYTFLISVNYTGPWTVTYQGYNSLGESNPIGASSSYNGTGFYSEPVTLSGPNNSGLTLCATAQKLSASNSALTVSVEGSNGTSSFSSYAYISSDGSTWYCGSAAS